MNKIYTTIILSFFSLFVYANSIIYNKGDIGIDKSQNKTEANLINNQKGEKLTCNYTKSVRKKDKVKKKKYKVWVTLINQKDKIKGYLYTVNESSIVVSPSSEIVLDHLSSYSSKDTISIANISKIKLRRKGSIWKGYIIGTSIGIGTGIILAVAGEGDSFTVFAAAGMLGIMGSAIGVPIGNLSGTKNYNIGGNQNTFLTFQQELKACSLVGD